MVDNSLLTGYNIGISFPGTGEVPEKTKMPYEAVTK
jgi:hypothetical protein